MINIDRNNVELLKKEADTFRRMRKYKEELDCLGKILKLEPDNKVAKNRYEDLISYFRTQLMYGKYRNI